MPVRRAIQSALTPTRAPSSALVTRRSGRAVPKPATAPVRSAGDSASNGLSPVSTRGSTDTGRLRQLLELEHGRFGQVAGDQPREHRSRPEVQKSVRLDLAERDHRLAPADRAEDPRRQLGRGSVNGAAVAPQITGTRGGANSTRMSSASNGSTAEAIAGE